MKRIFVALLFVSALVTSCKKDKDPDPVQCTAGTGGNVNLTAYLVHHADTITNGILYIKYNAVNFPGHPDTINYEASYTMDTGEDHIIVSGLKCGKYFLWGMAYDNAISDSVVGGIPLNLIQTSGTLNFIVPVTED